MDGHWAAMLILVGAAAIGGCQTAGGGGAPATADFSSPALSADQVPDSLEAVGQAIAFRIAGIDAKNIDVSSPSVTGSAAIAVPEGWAPVGLKLSELSYTTNAPVGEDGNAFAAAGWFRFADDQGRTAAAVFSANYRVETGSAGGSVSIIEQATVMPVEDRPMEVEIVILPRAQFQALAAAQFAFYESARAATHGVVPRDGDGRQVAVAFFKSPIISGAKALLMLSNSARSGRGNEELTIYRDYPGGFRMAVMPVDPGEERITERLFAKAVYLPAGGGWLDWKVLGAKPLMMQQGS